MLLQRNQQFKMTIHLVLENHLKGNKYTSILVGFHTHSAQHTTTLRLHAKQMKKISEQNEGNEQKVLGKVNGYLF